MSNIYKKLVLIFAITVVITSCSSKNSSKSIIDELEIINTPLDDETVKQKKINDSIWHRKFVNEIIYTVSTLNSFEGAFIGFEGRKSKQPDYASILSKNCKVEELVQLTNHNSPYVRVTAFNALYILNYKKIKDIFISHINDKNAVMHFSGCVVDAFPVNISFYKRLSSNLNKSEKIFYKNKILKMYDNLPYYEIMMMY